MEGLWGATVNVKPIDLEKDPGFSKITAAGILRQHLINMMRTFALSEPEPNKLQNLINLAIPILLGFLAGIVANSKGWF